MISKNEEKLVQMGPLEYGISIVGNKPELPHLQKKYDRNWYFEMYPHLCLNYYILLENAVLRYKDMILCLYKRGVKIPSNTKNKILNFFGEDIFEFE